MNELYEDEMTNEEVAMLLNDDTEEKADRHVCLISLFYLSFPLAQFLHLLYTEPLFLIPSSASENKDEDQS